MQQLTRESALPKHLLFVPLQLLDPPLLLDSFSDVTMLDNVPAIEPIVTWTKKVTKMKKYIQNIWGSNPGPPVLEVSVLATSCGTAASYHFSYIFLLQQCDSRGNL